jgi:hypothetical protein
MLELRQSLFSAYSLLTAVLEKYITLSSSSSSRVGGDCSADTSGINQQQQQQQQRLWCNGTPVWLLPLAVTSIEIAAAWPGSTLTKPIAYGEGVRMVRAVLTAELCDRPLAAASVAAVLLQTLLHKLGAAVLETYQGTLAATGLDKQQQQQEQQEQQQQGDAVDGQVFEQQQAAAVWNEYIQLLEELLGE